MARDAVKDVADLLRVREAQGLRIPVWTRIVFTSIALMSALASDEAAWAGGMKFGVGTVTGAMIVVNAYFLRLISQRERLALVGAAGVAMDAWGIASYGFIAHYLVLGGALSPIAVLKFPLLGVCLVFIVINSLALRALYPVLLGAASIATYVGVGVAAWLDPRTVWTGDSVEVVTTGAGSVGLLFGQCTFILVTAGGLAFYARSARRTLMDAVQLEAERWRLHREQAELATASKLQALSKLVAAVSHDLNTPLGALTSAAATLGLAGGRLREELEPWEQDGRCGPRTGRALKAIAQSSQVCAHASQRIAARIESLRSFTHLDQADFRRVDLHEGLDTALDLVAPEARRGCRVRREYGQVPPVFCDVRRINQVFLTVLTNAFEAIDGEGTVTIRTEADGDLVQVRIADTGRGIPPGRQQDLFTAHFVSKEARMSVGLGLAASQSILHQHGGDIAVEQTSERGTTFLLTLPLRAPRT